MPCVLVQLAGALWRKPRASQGPLQAQVGRAPPYPSPGSQEDKLVTTAISSSRGSEAHREWDQAGSHRRQGGSCAVPPKAYLISCPAGTGPFRAWALAESEEKEKGWGRGEGGGKQVLESAEQPAEMGQSRWGRRHLL